MRNSRRAPDLTIGGSSVTLDGMRYRIHLDLRTRAAGGRRRPDARGHARPTGAADRDHRRAGLAHGLRGAGDVREARRRDRRRRRARLARRRTGYHDHNWGFWKGVSWQWGQVQHGRSVAALRPRVPAADAADPERCPASSACWAPTARSATPPTCASPKTNDDRGRPRSDHRSRARHGARPRAAVRRGIGGDDADGTGPARQRRRLPAAARRLHRQRPRRRTRHRLHGAGAAETFRERTRFTLGHVEARARAARRSARAGGGARAASAYPRAAAAPVRRSSHAPAVRQRPGAGRFPRGSSRSRARVADRPRDVASSRKP